MKIFGLTIMTEKEVTKINEAHEEALREKQFMSDYYEHGQYLAEEEINRLREMFPFDLGQVVYDLQLKSAKGRYTKTKPSFEHSVINKVTVDEKNYFGLVTRYNNHDVFFTNSEAEAWLKSVCEKK